MVTSSRSTKIGTSLALAAAAGLFLSACAQGQDSAAEVAAESEAVTGGGNLNIDPVVVDFYLESRTQRPAEQATAEQREAILQEITDIYLLTTQPVAEELLSTSDKLRAQLELQRRAAIAQAVAEDFLAKNQATDEEILEQYEAQIQLAPPLQFKARHILVETEDAAAGLITQLDEGAEFAELAQTHSTGPSGPSGGDLGWFSPEQMVKPFSDAVAGLEDGAYTPEPVQTQFGWHVILREESRANEPPTLESVRPVIKQNIEQTKLQEFIEGLRSPEDTAS
jgi:peptidyl-prolyl cis-trans isomerase C